MYPRRRTAAVPASEREEDVDRVDTVETLELVDTSRSRRGQAPIAREGITSGEGDPSRRTSGVVLSISELTSAMLMVCC